MNPIISWSDADVWDFIRGNEIEYNPLYDCGYHRVGCVGCPVAGKNRWKEFADFPGFKEKYIKAFSEMLAKMRASGKNRAGRQAKTYSYGGWKTITYPDK